MIGILSFGSFLAKAINQDGQLPLSQKAPPPRVKDTSVPPKIETPQGSSTPLGRLSAQEAAKIALRLQPSIANAKGVVQTTQGRTQQAGAAQNPQLILGAGYDKLTSLSGGNPVSAPTGSTPSGVAPTFAYSSTLAVRQLLFDFNLTRNLVRQNSALSDAAMANLDRTQQDVVNEVENNFYNELNAKRLVDVSEKNLENRQRQLDLADSRFRNNIGQPADVVTAETSKSQAVLALVVARDAEVQARVKLLQSMGVDPLTPIDLSDADESAASVGDPAKLTETGLKNRPEIRVAKFNMVASVFGLEAAKSTSMPAFYASIAAGTLGQDISSSRGTASIGIGVQFALGDGGLRRGAVTTANGQVASAKADYNTAVLKVKSDVAGAYLGLVSAEQRVTIAEAEVANAREGVRVAEGRYATGLGSFQDITTAQSLLVSALQDQTTVQTNLNLARVRLKYATGEIK